MVLLGDVDVSALSAVFAKPGKDVGVDSATKALVRPLLRAAFDGGSAQTAHDVAVAAGAKCGCAGKSKVVTTASARDVLARAAARVKTFDFGARMAIAEADSGGRC